MQKKLIALAVAALASTGAMAQVTFYGVLDAGIARVSGEQTTGDDKEFNGILTGNLSGSRLGVTAEEDLGGGLKALGRLEMGTLAIDSATNNINSTRQSFVGFSSGAGTLVVGRLQTPGYDIGVKHDALGAGVFSPYATLANTAANSRSITNGGDMGRSNNAIGYTSPKLGPVVVKAVLARNASELSTATFNEDLATVGVEFSSGPLDISAAYASISESKAATTDHSEYVIGANFNLGAAKLMAMYIGTEDDKATGSDPQGSLIQVGVQVPVGKGTIKVAVGRAEMDGVAGDDATTFGLDYEHAFGKRTTGYVGLNRTDVGGHSTLAIGGVSASADKSITAIAAGVRLTF